MGARRFRVVAGGNVYDIDSLDDEEAAREVMEDRVWPDDPPGDGDAVTAHVVELIDGVPVGEVTSWEVRASYSLSGHTLDADDEPTAADLRALGVS